ncbi:MAG: hypothetical protein RLP09_01280 [Sandaracinaceae bacterium]
MADSPVFDWVAEALEEETSFSTIQARGTVRLVLKEAGISPFELTVAQLEVLIDRLFHAALVTRGVAPERATGVCTALAEGLRARASRGDLEAHGESAHDVFARLGRRRR